MPETRMTSPASRADYTPTPDRRYFVLRGRLWRLSNPSLDPRVHEQWVQELLSAKRAVHDAATPQERIAARLKVDEAKRRLGERGDPWWNDGAPDYNRHFALNTPYAAWFTKSSA
jgi:hypothetical protein